MRYLKTTGIVMILIVWACVPIFGQEVTVTATGQGAGDKVAAENAALQDAMRKAVEKGCGVFISSKSKTKDFVLVEDQIYSESKGFITKYEVLGKDYDETETIATVKISATVSKKLLEGKWEQYETLLQRVGRPKLMFATLLKLNAKPMAKDESTAERHMKAAFQEARMITVNKGLWDDKKKMALGAANLKGQIGEMVALSKQFGAQVLIRGSVHCRHTGTEKYAGVTSHRFTWNYEFDFIRVSDAVEIFSYADSWYDIEDATHPIEGYQIGVKKFSKMVGGILRRKLMHAWAFKVQNYMIFNLQIKKAKFKHGRKLEKWLKTVDWVKKVYRDRYDSDNETVYMRVETKITNINDLGDKIEEESPVKMEVENIDKQTVIFTTKVDDD